MKYLTVKWPRSKLGTVSATWFYFSRLPSRFRNLQIGYFNFRILRQQICLLSIILCQEYIIRSLYCELKAASLSPFIVYSWFASAIHWNICWVRIYLHTETLFCWVWFCWGFQMSSNVLVAACLKLIKWHN